MENTELAWLAGIIDGEGMISAYLSFQKKSYAMHYCIAITNSDPDIMAQSNKIVTEIVGHSVINYLKDKSSVRYLAWQIQVQNRRDVILVLNAILPYLVGKKSQAQLLLTVAKSHVNGTGVSKVEKQAIEILKKMKNNKLVSVDGNAELKQKSVDFCKGVEHIETTTQFNMFDLS